MCQSTATSACEAVKVNLISILGFVGKMAAKKDNTLDILTVTVIPLGSDVFRIKVKTAASFLLLEP